MYKSEDRLNAILEQGENKVVSSRLKRLHKHIPGSTLSIKHCTIGTERYLVNNNHIKLQQGNYLVVNQGSEVTIDFSSNESVHGLCIFLSQDIIRCVYEATFQKDVLTGPTDYLNTPGFYEDVYSIKTGGLGWLLRGLNTCQLTEIDDQEAFYFQIAEQLILDHYQVENTLDRLKSIKPSTRRELYKRLLIAKHYLHASTNEPIGLDQLAQVTALSKYHLLRSFQSYFGITPKKYSDQLRLGIAKDRIMKEDIPVNQLAFELGFQDLPTFSKAFKRFYGIAPSRLQLSWKRA